MAASNIVTRFSVLQLVRVVRATNKSRTSLLSSRSYSTSIVTHARGGGHRQKGGHNQTSGVVIQDSSIDNALQTVKTRVSKLELRPTEVNLFLGIGQYFRNPKRDRVFVLHAKSGLDNFSAAELCNNNFMEPLLDCSLQSCDVDMLLDELHKISNHVYSGEVNAVDNRPWTQGFVLGDHFKIFSQTLLQCHLNMASFEYATEGKLEQIPIDEISSVIVGLSEEPWNNQTLSVECKSGNIVPLLTFSNENEYRDLAMLMVDTEWSVKAAALLCLKLRKFGNSIVQLKLPKVLTIQGNPWVETRHDLWTKFST